MTKVPVDQFLSRIKQALNEQWGYVYSGQGELYDEAMASRFVALGRPYSQGNSAIEYFLTICKKWFGRRVADCSGLICWAVEDITKEKYDLNSQSLRNGFVKCGAIATIPETPGLAVWLPGHIGVYIGGGYVIEARGTGYGVVKTKLAERSFTHWGELAAVDYAAQAMAETQVTYPATIGGNGGAVNFRKQPNGAVIGPIFKGDPVMAEPPEGEWVRVLVPGYVHNCFVIFNEG